MTTTFQELWSLMQTSHFWIGVSPTPSAAGRSACCCATVLAVPLGIFLGSSDFAARAFRVPIEFLRPIPSAALIPVLFLTLGTTLKSEVFLAAFGAFWPLLIQTIYGVRDVDPRRDRHRALVRRRPLRAPLPDHAAERRCRTSRPACASRRRSR